MIANVLHNSWHLSQAFFFFLFSPFFFECGRDYITPIQLYTLHSNIIGGKEVKDIV